MPQRPHQTTVSGPLPWSRRTWGQRVDRVVIGKRPANRAGLPWWQHVLTYVVLLGHVLIGRNLRLTIRWCLLLAALLVLGAAGVGLVGWVVQAVTR